MLRMLAVLWQKVPLVAAADRWILGSTLSLFHAVITTPATQVVVLAGLVFIATVKYVHRGVHSRVNSMAVDFKATMQAAAAYCVHCSALACFGACGRRGNECSAVVLLASARSCMHVYCRYLFEYGPNLLQQVQQLGLDHQDAPAPPETHSPEVTTSTGRGPTTPTCSEAGLISTH